MSQKVILIALDGATFDLIKPWMEAGKLPLLKRLIDGGHSGLLKSTVPWATPTAFASMATGTNPGKHGVYDFGVLIKADYTAFVPTSGAHVHGKTVWDRLSDAGKSSLIINMPMTYPADSNPAFNGTIVAGIPYPSGSKRVCFPADAVEKLKAHGWDLSRNASDDLRGNYADYHAGLLDLVRVRGEATTHLIAQEQADFVAVHFLETDQVQHRFWQFLPDEPKHKPGHPLTDAILQLYEAVEVAIEQIMEAADPDTTFILMSDHGFGATRQQVWVNNWLMAHRYLQLKQGIGVAVKRWLYRVGLSPAAIREAAPERVKLAILQFFERQKGRAMADGTNRTDEAVQKKGIVDWLTERLAIDFYDVDWGKTVAFSTGTTAVGYIYLNRIGRDPQGIVHEDEVDGLRDKIKADLLMWRGDDGEPMVRDVQFGGELWHGETIERAPDLVIFWAAETTDARYFQTRFSHHKLQKRVPNDYASHRLQGMFAVCGNGVQAGQSDADILDLAPTILWLMGEPIPSYMDGRPLTNLFTTNHTVERVEEEVETGGSEELSAAEMAQIEQSLRNLGYME